MKELPSTFYFFLSFLAISPFSQSCSRIHVNEGCGRHLTHSIDKCRKKSPKPPPSVLTGFAASEDSVPLYRNITVTEGTV